MVQKKASDSCVLESYARLQNVWKVGHEIGISGQSVHVRLKRLKKSNPRNTWTEEKQKLLLDRYKEFSTIGKLDDLARILGTHKTTLCGRARKLGLTNPNISRKFLSEKAKESSSAWHKNNPHPKGMLGKKHSQKSLEAISAASKLSWSNKTEKQKREKTLKMIKTKRANGTTAPSRTGVRWKGGWREIGGYKKYYRSRWEANYARYLEWLKSLGYIESWEHEKMVFWFDGVRRGCVSYLPDFRVVDKNGECFHEVKGWMDPASKTKLKRMKKYHPTVRLILIEAKEYKEILNKVSRLIPDWEF